MYDRGVRCAAACVVVVAAGLSCESGESSRLRVDVVCDLIADIEFDRVEVHVDDEPAGSAPARGAGDWLAGIKVFDGTADPGGRVVVAQALLNGRVVQSQRALVRVDARSAATLYLTRECAGVSCPGDGDSPRHTLCLNGRCVDEHCVQGTEAECASNYNPCSDASMCSVLACAAPICTEFGVCLTGAALCESDQYCDPGTEMCRDYTETMPGADAGAEMMLDGGDASMCPATCDDGDPCTSDECVAGACSHDNICQGGAVVQLVAHAFRTCMIRSESAPGGTLWCWGQTGLDAGNVAAPVQVASEFDDITEIAVGDALACFVRSNGDLHCWGGQAQVGSVGDGTSNVYTSPVRVMGGAHGISVGQMHACTLVGTEVRCWGWNWADQAGVPSPMTVRRPTTVPGLPPMRQVLALGQYTMALAEDGSVWGWGSLGVFGAAPYRLPIAVNGEEIAPCYGGSSCVRSSGGEVSQLVVATAGSGEAVAVPVSGAVRLHGGAGAGCVETASDFQCFGTAEQLGISTRANRGDLVSLGSSDAIERIAFGADHSCTLRADGSVWCVGSPGRGRLGNGSFAGPTPVRVEALTDAQEICAGQAHACARLGDGTVHCWGDNTFGQLGDGTEIARGEPVRFADIADARLLACGDSETCVMHGDRLHCVGYDGGNNGTIVQRDIAGVIAVATGSYKGTSNRDRPHRCVHLNDGTVQCWGSNSGGQVGVGSVGSQVTSPTSIGLSGVSHVELGEHGCAYSVVGELWCWGTNDDGQLGIGTTDVSSAPASVALSNVRQVGVGTDHTCAIQSDGSLYCWGANAQGQLGDGTMDSSLVPIAVGGLTDVEAVAAGETHTCAIRAGGVWCFGSDVFGALGNGGADADSVVPTAVDGLSGVTQIRAGERFTCALTSSGEVFCWGDNATGQLGVHDLYAPQRVFGT